MKWVDNRIVVERGLFLNPGEKFYVSLAHTDEDVDRTLEIFADALDAIA